MASSYNARPLPPEVLVDRASWAIVQERVSVDDMLARQHLPPWLARRDETDRPAVAARGAMTSVPARTNDRRGDRRYRGLLALASAALFWERLWPRLWPAACILGAFVALALFDMLPVLPDWLHAGILALFAVGFVAAIAVGMAGFSPDRP